MNRHTAVTTLCKITSLVDSSFILMPSSSRISIQAFWNHSSFYILASFSFTASTSWSDERVWAYLGNIYLLEKHSKMVQNWHTMDTDLSKALCLIQVLSYLSWLWWGFAVQLTSFRCCYSIWFKTVTEAHRITLLDCCYCIKRCCPWVSH